MEDVKERGAAEMIVDLHKGIITVRHGEGSHPILAQWTANAGDWERLWTTINALKASAGCIFEHDHSDGQCQFVES